MHRSTIHIHSLPQTMNNSRCFDMIKYCFLSYFEKHGIWQRGFSRAFCITKRSIKHERKSQISLISQMFLLDEIKWVVDGNFYFLLLQSHMPFIRRDLKHFSSPCILLNYFICDFISSYFYILHYFNSKLLSIILYFFIIFFIF